LSVAGSYSSLLKRENANLHFESQVTFFYNFCCHKKKRIVSRLRYAIIRSYYLPQRICRILAHNREDVGPLLVSNQGVLADIRFPEEVATWRMGFGLAIPLNELPRRLAGLPKNKIIITACPHKDRSAIAMAYLRSKGYETKYLTNGLLGLAEQLRGERAKDFMAKLAKIKTGQKK